MEGDFLSLRLGRDVGVPAAELDKSVKEFSGPLPDAPQPAVKLTLYQIAFLSGRDLTSFCDASGEASTALRQASQSGQPAARLRS